MELTSSLQYIREYEIYLGFATVYILFLLTCVTIFLIFAIRRVKYSKGIPSKRMSFWDVWGCISDIVSVGRCKGVSLNVYILQAFAGYDRLFKKEKFFYMWFSYSPFIIITKAEAIEGLIAGSKNMEKSWVYDFLHAWLGTGLLTSHGSKWKTRRKLLTPSFHFEILKDFLPIFNEQAQICVKLLEKETKTPWTNIIPPITLCTLDIVCETTLGVAVGAQENSESEYVKAIQRSSESMMHRMLNPLQWINGYYYYISSNGRQQKKDIILLHNFTRSIIASKKKALLSGDDTINQTRKRKALMDVLLEHHIKTQTLSEDDIREEVDTFAFEGHDTTSMGINWALYLIGLYKDVQENIHEELDRIFGDDTERPITTDDLKDMEYLERVLKESQRLYPSVPLFGRKLNQDITLCGKKIPKDVTCLVLTFLVHRDESVFPNPEKFDPDRFLPENSANRHPFAYIPFSAGPRNCIGQRFAIMEEKVVVGNILRKYTLESLDARDKVLPATEVILRTDGPIRIRIRPRSIHR